MERLDFLLGRVESHVKNSTCRHSRRALKNPVKPTRDFSTFDLFKACFLTAWCFIFSQLTSWNIWFMFVSIYKLQCKSNILRNIFLHWETFTTLQNWADTRDGSDLTEPVRLLDRGVELLEEEIPGSWGENRLFYKLLGLKGGFIFTLVTQLSAATSRRAADPLWCSVNLS